MGGLRIPLFLIGALAGPIFLSGGVILVSTASRGLEASKLRTDREESEARRLYSQIKYGEAFERRKLPGGIAPSNTSDESTAEGGTAADLTSAGDPPERPTGNAPPTTIDRKDPWTD